MKLRINFGGLREPIDKQLKDHGIHFAKPFSKKLEDDAMAILRLRIQGLISNSEAAKAENRLFKKIVRNLKYAKITTP